MTIMFMGDSVDNQLFHAVEHALGQTATHRRGEAYRKVGIGRYTSRWRLGASLLASTDPTTTA